MKHGAAMFTRFAFFQNQFFVGCGAKLKSTTLATSYFFNFHEPPNQARMSALVRGRRQLGCFFTSFISTVSRVLRTRT